MAVVEVVLIVTVIVSPLAIEGQSARHSELTKEYPQNTLDECLAQAHRVSRSHGVNHTVIAVCVPTDKYEPK